MSFDQKHIEDYVLGRLGDEERSAFQFALMREKKLRQEVEAMRVLQKMARANKNKRRSLLFFSSRRMVRVAAVFIGLVTLAALIALFSRNNKEPDFVEDEKQPVIEQPQNINEQQLEEQLKELSPQEDLVESPEKEIKDSTETKVVESPVPKKEAPKAPGPLQDFAPQKLSNFDSPINNLPEDQPKPFQPLDDDTTSLAHILDTFQYKLVEQNHTEVASISHRFILDENGDTIEWLKFIPVRYKDSLFNIRHTNVESTEVDSFRATKHAQEMRSFPPRVKLSITTKKRLQFINLTFPEPPTTRQNPILEKYIDQAPRNDSIAVYFQDASETFVRDTNAMLELHFYCDSYGKFDGMVIFKIYSNREKEILNNLPRPMVEVGCIVGERPRFSILGNFPVGLYYLVFERTNGEFLGAKKIYVVDP